MIEKTICDYLSDKLDYPVSLEVPREPPRRYVIIEKLGSGETNHIYSAMIAVKSVRNHFMRRALLNDRVKAAMQGMIELNDICRVKLTAITISPIRTQRDTVSGGI
jgi:hypothetical protein